MQPTKEWLKKWEKVKDKLQPNSNLVNYFTLKEIAGKEIDVMDIGPCSIPTGEFLVGDPLVYLRDIKQEVYLQKIPTGEFKTEVCVVKASDGDCDRYAAIRLKFNDNKIAYYEEAMVGNEEFDNIQEGDYFGFNVDAGLACICDKKLHKLYCDFDRKFDKENPDGNIYDDYFAKLFEESYKDNPKYQRDGGDWINWTIPDTNYHLPMFQSGFGDGAYPVYLAYDKDGNVCQLIVELIDIELAYSEIDKEDAE
ncbi:DUF4241 domain-containing protein [Fusobacterium watanabei]|uniref:DUF4241 domain-containing protein n=1 Tax=Fusobacterium TaxID=848 RepID=UPI00235E861C|nr:DUF4241 domain-containing protein [Fusobacterium nucleatum]WDA46682.1 DUF4241 domain-containing protein [Fusobacterium nucleatum]